MSGQFRTQAMFLTSPEFSWGDRWQKSSCCCSLRAGSEDISQNDSAFWPWAPLKFPSIFHHLCLVEVGGKKNYSAYGILGKGFQKKKICFQLSKIYVLTKSTTHNDSRKMIKLSIIFLLLKSKCVQVLAPLEQTKLCNQNAKLVPPCVNIPAVCLAFYTIFSNASARPPWQMFSARS